MEMVKYDFVVGVDISSEKITYCLMQNGTSLHVEDDVPNTEDGFLSMLKSIKEFGANDLNTLFCMEYTGSYSLPLSYFLSKKNCQIWVEDGCKIHNFTGRGKRKTDKVDSIHIATYAYRNMDLYKKWEPKDLKTEQVNALLVYRELLVKTSTAISNQMHAFKKTGLDFDRVISQMEEGWKNLKATLKWIEKAVKEIIESDKNQAQKSSQLKSIPGIADISMAHIFVYTNGYKFVPNAKKMLAHLGFAPMDYESGSSIKRRSKSTGFGDLDMRKIFYTAALANTKRGPLGAYYQRLKASGKKGLIPMNNLKAKLVKLICAILRDGKPYIDNYVSIEPRLRQS